MRKWCASEVVAHVHGRARDIKLEDFAGIQQYVKGLQCSLMWRHPQVILTELGSSDTPLVYKVSSQLTVLPAPDSEPCRLMKHCHAEQRSGSCGPD